MTSCSATRSNNNSSIPPSQLTVSSVEKTHKLSDIRKKILEESFEWLGTPYKYVGQDKGNGTDCSGLVLKVYLDVVGIKLPRNSAAQAEFCKEIREKDVKIGDLVFFATGKNANTISHVGIVVDENNFIHASTSKGVLVSSFRTPYYMSKLIKFGRVPGIN